MPHVHQRRHVSKPDCPRELPRPAAKRAPPAPGALSGGAGGIPVDICMLYAVGTAAREGTPCCPPRNAELTTRPLKRVVPGMPLRGENDGPTLWRRTLVSSWPAKKAKPPSAEQVQVQVDICRSACLLALAVGARGRRLGSWTIN